MSDFYKFIFTFLLLFSAFNQSFSDEVNVYTSRHYDSDNAIYEDFTNLTGINVNIISGKGKALMERLRLEGKNSPADLFITSDAGNLWKIQKDGMFRKIQSWSFYMLRKKLAILKYMSKYCGKKMKHNLLINRNNKIFSVKSRYA